MAEFVKPTGERIKELEEILNGWVHRKRAAISDGRDPERVNREIANLNTYIDRCQKQIAALVERRDNWREICETAENRIAELRLEIDGLKGVAKEVVNESPEQQLLAIVKLANQLGISQADLETMMAASKVQEVGVTNGG